MVEHRRVGNVRYHDYSPLSLEYVPRQDGYIIAGADIYAPDDRYHVAVRVVVTDRHAIRDLASLNATISRGRVLLDRLIDEYRSGVDWLSDDVTLTFGLDGRLFS